MTLERKAVVGVVNNNNNILLGKKKDGAKGFLSGQWHIPGETVEPGESDELALKRGIKEEAGIEIEILRYMATHYTKTPTEVRWYECLPKTYDIRPGSDLTEVIWLPRLEVIPYLNANGRATSLWPKEIFEYFSIRR